MQTMFFIISKLVGALIRPDTWLVIALGLIVLTLSSNRQRFALALCIMTFTAVAVLAIFPLGNILLQPIERSYPANPPLSRVDGIIVLGGGEDVRASTFWGQSQLSEGGERFTAALALARRFPKARLLYTGGSGELRDLAGNSTSGAAMAGQFFRDQGISQERLLFEGKSRNTTENARFSFAMASPCQNEVWVLVTSAFHMPRSIHSFTSAGWQNLVPFPVDYRTSSFVDGIDWDLLHHFQILNIAIKEYVGLLAYWLTGR
ncbi:YdcF family protein [Desulforhopalus singaporensis]|uniref:Uncharacterized SAM-binding protein YcdF, DUF218 family n=1 Tax=Desulforhopalus singaporensis TaxID=91360 RepID=A0A1H0UY05_9BACT|nr:YdcF family protein [Desulforhopalus singaporensis]SDP71047.1 Uncharacterized SAM-binding protein YcdF, DUF218 family [Desulforhopalus singaporensis]